MSARGLPRIIVKPPQCDVNDAMRAALSRSKTFYKRSGQLVRVSYGDVDLPNEAERPPEAPCIRLVSAPLLAEELSRCAEYYRISRTLKDGTEITEPCHPPKFGIDAILAGECFSVPTLDGIVEAPVLLKSGKILDTPGYDSFSKLVYAPPPGSFFEPVSTNPTAQEVRGALDLLLDAICDFPFDRPEHRSVWIAGVLTYFSRWAYEGPTPFFLVDGNVRGAGKGKLAGAAAQICLGRRPMMVQQTSDEAKEKEMITSVALSGEMMVVIDNINYPLGSAPLDSVIAEQTWSPVLKYSNESSKFVVRAIWWGNGNNVVFKRLNDTIRRTLKMRIVSPLEHPEQRSDFKRPEPGYQQWLRDNRPALVWAALTLLRAFVEAGSPTSGLRSWGTFEAWSHVVRGAIVWAGLPDPYLAAAVHDQVSDGGLEALTGFLRGWDALCVEQKTEGLTCNEAMTALREHLEYAKSGAGRHNPHEDLVNAIRELTSHKSGGLPDPGALGYVLRRNRTRVVGGMRLESRPGPQNYTRWCVVRSGA